MQIYSVGGAVRDELLGLPVQDRDYVVVGSTPEEMVRLGVRPVGKDFPVYASPEVPLEEDLARRDLTINAIARDAQGKLIDPFGGAADLKAGILRHVSPAFAEDPVRILRVARFAARFADFGIAGETLEIMRRMV